MLYTVTPELLEQLADDNSDFYVRFYADEARQLNFMILRIIEWGKADHAGKYARQAASAGAKALEIIERRGSDDVEFFC